MNYKLNDILNINKLKKITKLFKKITKISIEIVDNNGKIIFSSENSSFCKKILKNEKINKFCYNSFSTILNNIKKKERFSHKCYFEIEHIIEPIIIEKKVLGAIIFNQFINKKPSKKVLSELSSKLGPLEENFIQFFNNIPIISKKRAYELADYYKTMIDIFIENELNIINQKKVQKILKTEEEKYRILAENVSDTVWTLDMNFNFTYISPAHFNLTGYDQEESLKNGLSKLATKESMTKINKLFKTELEKEISSPGSGGNKTFEIDIIHKCGKIINVEITANFIRDKKDDIIGISGITRNITERKKFELKLKKAHEKLTNYNKKLESDVKKRTFELLEINKKLKKEIEERKNAEKEQKKLLEKLTQAEKMRALGILAGGVAHDLNNILSSLTGYPDIILSKLPENSKLIPSIKEIKNAGLRAADIVDDLLTLARRGVKTNIILNLNNIIKDFLNSKRFKELKECYFNIKIKTELDNDLMNIEGSKIHLYKTIMNLIINSFEAMENRNGSIIIRTRNNISENTIILEVVDTGKGIEKKNIDKIFEPFYTNKKDEKSGTGLGMSVIWGTVNDHNGSIIVKSKINIGTKFVINLPATNRSILKKDKKFNIHDYYGNNKKILVIDDSEIQRDIFQTLLERLKYSVNCVSNINDAIKFIKKNNIDLVILDMILSNNENGLDCYKKILQIRPNQKAIIVSGFADDNRVSKTQGLGAGKYLKKPYTLDQLAIAVKEELEN